VRVLGVALFLFFCFNLDGSSLKEGDVKSKNKFVPKANRLLSCVNEAEKLLLASQDAGYPVSVEEAVAGVVGKMARDEELRLVEKTFLKRVAQRNLERRLRRKLREDESEGL